MYDSLGVSSSASVDERDVVSTIAGPNIIVNPGVDSGKNVANTVDLVNGVHGTKKKKNNKKKKKKKMKDMMIASTPSTADISLYMLLDSSSLVSVPYSTLHSVPLLPSLHQYTASNAMKAAKMKEERIHVCDDAAKYPGNSIDLHDYHAWCVDKNGDVCDYSNETLMKSVEHPSLEVIHQPFTAHIIPKWLVICEDQYNIYIQNMANANCGGDIDVMIAQPLSSSWSIPLIFLINAVIRVQNYYSRRSLC
jgi:hypothetical protein